MAQPALHHGGRFCARHGRAVGAPAGTTGARLPLPVPKRGKGDKFCSGLVVCLAVSLRRAIWPAAFSVS